MRGEDEVICYFGPGKAWVLGVGGGGGGGKDRLRYLCYMTSENSADVDGKQRQDQKHFQPPCR